MTVSGTPLSMTDADRLSRYAEISTALALWSDEELQQHLEEAAILNTGIGGLTARMALNDTAVFVKMVPLTVLEQQHVRSTANLFQLPPYCHYGIGSPGFGAWRELASHIMTTNWVLANQCPSFPILYHWRVVPRPHREAPIAEELRQVSQQSAFWGSAAVGNRLEAIAQAESSLVLCSEYLPHTLHDWLASHVVLGEDALNACLRLAESQIPKAVAFMNDHGLFHFDVHSRNLLTDGQRVYITDFGLAASTRFELSGSEAAFLTRNRRHDGAYALTDLVNELLRAFTDHAAWEDRIAFLHRVEEGPVPADIMATAACAIRRYAPIAAVINEFYWELAKKKRDTPFPAAQIEAMTVRP